MSGCVQSDAGFGLSSCSPLARPSYTVADLFTLDDDELQGAKMILVFGGDEHIS